MIPVLITPDGDKLQDTSVIIDALELEYPAVWIYPATPLQNLLAPLLESFGDEWLKLPAMHYRWNYNMQFAIAELGALSRPDLSCEEQIVISSRTSKSFAGSLPFLGVTAASIPAIEESYETLLKELDDHLANYPFLFGDRMSIGDLGLIGPMYAHLYREPASGETMQRLAPAVVKWVERMMNRLTESGEFLPYDEVPESLNPIIQSMIDEQFPVILATANRLTEWIEENPRQEIPRAIGTHEFTLLKNTDREVTEQRGVFPYQLWMLQRAHDAYHNLDTESRDRVNQYLAPIGAL